MRACVRACVCAESARSQSVHFSAFQSAHLSAFFHHAQIANNEKDSVWMRGSGQQLLERSLVLSNGAIGVLVQGERSCHAVLTDCCMVANRKGPVLLSKEPGVEAKGNILSGAQSKGAMPTALEGGLLEDQVFEGNTLDGVLHRHKTKIMAAQTCW